MKGLCPECGCTADLTAFIADSQARQAVAEALSVPAEVGGPLLRYLGLFRPANRALSWGRFERLLKEVSGAVRARQVRRHGRDWPAPLEVWCAALEEIVERRDKLQLPLRSHGYLYEIVAGAANRAEARAEAERELARAAPPRPGGERPAGPRQVGEIIEQISATRESREAGLRELRQHCARLGLRRTPDAEGGS